MKQILGWSTLGTTLFLLCSSCAPPQYYDWTGERFLSMGIPITPRATLPDRVPGLSTGLPLKLGLRLDQLQIPELYEDGLFNIGTRMTRGQGLTIKLGASSAQLFREGFAQSFESVKVIEGSANSEQYDLLATPSIACFGARRKGEDMFDVALRYQVTLADRKGNTNVVTSRMANVIYDRPWTWKDWALLPFHFAGWGIGIVYSELDAYLQAVEQTESQAYQDLEQKLRSHLEERRHVTGAYDHLRPADENPVGKIKIMLQRLLAQIPSTPTLSIAIGCCVRTDGVDTMFDTQLVEALWDNPATFEPHKRLWRFEQEATLKQMQKRSGDLNGSVSAKDLADPEIAKQLATYSRANTVLVMTVGYQDDLIVVAAKLYDIQTGDTLAMDETSIRKGQAFSTCNRDLTRWRKGVGPPPE